MASQREVEVYTYTLNVQSIKMKVKFACKMKLQYNGEVLTPDVTSNDAGKFIFNQEVTMAQEFQKDHFQIIAHLNTQKGAKYIAGIIRLDPKQMCNQEGEMLIVPLYKCLDSEAICELRVDQVSSEKVAKPLGYDRNRGDLSPMYKNIDVKKNNFASKSQYQFPLSNNKPLHNWTRQQGNLSHYPRNRSPNNFKKSTVAVTHMQRNFHDGFDQSNRDRLIQAEVYKESYHKLKDKYKKQAETAKHEMNKRITLQSNQNNYRLEIMRLKLKNEEQQKSINDKNNRIKELQIQVGAFQKKELDLAYFREENDNKDYTIKMLEETIKTLNRDNDDLKALNRQRFQGQQEKIRELRNQLDKAKQKFESRQSELEKQNRRQSDLLLQKQSELRMKDDRLDREQKLVDDLEKSNQMKMLEFQRTLQNERSQWKIKNEDLKNIIERLERQKSRLEEELKESKVQTDKIKSYIIKIEYDKKIMNQQSDTLKHQLNEHKILKEKYQQLTREHRLLTQDKNHMQKQLQKSLHSKDSNIQDITKQFQEQTDLYKKNYRELQQKYKNYQSRNLELENNLEQKKNELEKTKKNCDNLNKQLSQEKQKQKSLKKSIKGKQEEISSLNAELQNYKQKFRSGDQMAKLEIDNLRQQNQKLKRDSELQYSKTLQLSEKLSKSNEEVMNSRLKLQQAEDSSEKNSALAKQKQSNLESQIKERDRKIENYESTINNLRGSDKQNQEKIQKFELETLKYMQRISTLETNNKNLQQQVSSITNSGKSKQKQLQSQIKTKQQLQSKITELEDKLSNTKNNFNVITGEKNKNEKIIQLLNKDIAELKQDNNKYQLSLTEKDKEEEILRNQIKKNKEEILKMQMKNNTLKKQYDRFKQQLQQTLINAYGQVPMNNDLKSSNVSDVIYRRENSEIFSNNDIINRVTTQYKEIKNAMNKHIEQNKIYKTEIQKLSQQILNNGIKTQSDRSDLEKHIQSLEQQLSKVQAEKQENLIKLNQKISELNEELDRRQGQIDQLGAQVEQLNFTINSMQMDAQANSEHYNIKYNQYKTKISELQQKINYLTRTIEDFELNQQQLQNRLAERTLQFESQKQNVHKKDKSIDELKAQKKTFVQAIEENKKQRKQLLEKISDLQLRLNTQIQVNEKSRQQLFDQQHKSSELKEFVANLMKQKQNAIKSDLEKSQQIIKFEMQLSELNRDKQMQIQENERMKKIIEDQKDSIKKLSHQVKQLETFGSDQKGKYKRTVQRLKEVQRDLKNSQQEYNSLEREHEKSVSKSNKQIAQLEQLLEQKQKTFEQTNTQLQTKMIELQKLSEQLTADKSTLTKQIAILEEQLFTNKQNFEQKLECCDSLQQQLLDTKNRLKSLTQTINILNEEIKQKEEGLFEMSGKQYNLQIKLENMRIEKNQTIETINDQWSLKYEDLKNQYEERIKLIEKERDHLRQRIKQIEEEHRKTVAELRGMELDDNNFKKILEDKIRRLQEDRLGVITSKNNEIQRISEEAKINFDALKGKQADLRRLQHELQVARGTISKLDLNKRETEQKIRNINKVYQGQLEQIKRREAQNRMSKENLNRTQWDLQREIKKMMQNFTRKAISGESKQSSQKMLELVRDFEQEITTLLNEKLEEIK